MPEATGFGIYGRESANLWLNTGLQRYYRLPFASVNYPPPDLTSISERQHRVDYSESEQQLKIWKDMAISKQMVMNEAATALNLKGEWTQDEFQVALDAAIKRGNEAETQINRTKAETEAAIAEMTARVKVADKATQESKSEAESALAAQQQAEQQLQNGRKDNAEAVKKARQLVADKDRELKAINTALADTPENVLKKLKTLKKQKHDEAQLRTKAEDANRKLKKEKKKVEEDLEEKTKLLEKASSLATSHRELHEICESMHKALKDAGVDAETLPVLDTALLEAFDTESDSSTTKEKELASA